MKIQIAGSGCPKCKMTEKVFRDACNELNIDADISHLYDIKEFAKLGIRFTPAVIIDGKVVLSGKVPSVEEAKELLKKQ